MRNYRSVWWFQNQKWQWWTNGDHWDPLSFWPTYLLCFFLSSSSSSSSSSFFVSLSLSLSLFSFFLSFWVVGSSFRLSLKVSTPNPNPQGSASQVDPPLHLRCSLERERASGKLDQTPDACVPNCRCDAIKGIVHSMECGHVRKEAWIPQNKNPSVDSSEAQGQLQKPTEDPSTRRPAVIKIYFCWIGRFWFLQWRHVVALLQLLCLMLDCFSWLPNEWRVRIPQPCTQIHT